ncbi:ABC transporter ATP-binding protein [Actinophytocola sp.]|jgi:branched-chain amino acid transport system ATP-binding protein|uniref:ABC transporter ATP-binding protein n=1 Tax=Actinophytocola sp. TaxID=1872138 RepID=UPI002ED89D67
MTTSDAPLLAVHALTRRFGGLTAVDQVSLAVAPGTVHAIIGPNGAGKTTLLDLMTGFTKPDSGRVEFAGKDITGTRPHRLPAMGLARTFQSARLVHTLTVRENVMLGAYRFTRARFLSDGLRLPRTRREERASAGRADELLAFLELEQFADTPAADVPAGAQRLVEVARGLATGPDLLLLDEPAAGLDDTETADLAAALHAVRAGGISLVVIEHNMELVMTVSDRVTVLDAGKVIADGAPHEVQANPDVIAAYLGVKP